MSSPLLELRNVNKRFGGLKAVDDVTLSVAPGEILGLIGPNGAGKTTLFSLISGAITPDSGSIIFTGRQLNGLRAYDICRAGIGRTFQIVRPLVTLTVLENVVVGALVRNSRAHAYAKAGEIVEYLGLEPLAHKLAGSLTLESRKRLEVARALATEPQLLLLDEVLAGLNPTEVEQAVELVRQIAVRGLAIIMIEHNLSAVMSLAHRVVVLNYGRKIADGLPEHVVRDPAVVEAYLGGDL